MAQVTLETFGRFLADHRDKLGLGVRAAAEQIKIAHSTLSRVESGYLPDLNSFKKICRWLQIDPGKVLGYAGTSKTDAGASLPAISAHFRKDATVSVETAQALADVILAAERALAVQQKF